MNFILLDSPFNSSANNLEALHEIVFLIEQSDAYLVSLLEYDKIYEHQLFSYSEAK